MAERRAATVAPARQRGPQRRRLARSLQVTGDPAAAGGHGHDPAFTGGVPVAAASHSADAGPVLGINALAGGAAVRYDPWVCYAAGVVTSPNMIVAGQLGRGKSALVKTYLHRQLARRPAGLHARPERGVRAARRRAGPAADPRCSPAGPTGSTRSTRRPARSAKQIATVPRGGRRRARRHRARPRAHRRGTRRASPPPSAACRPTACSATSSTALLHPTHGDGRRAVHHPDGAGCQRAAGRARAAPTALR